MKKILAVMAVTIFFSSCDFLDVSLVDYLQEGWTQSLRVDTAGPPSPVRFAGLKVIEGGVEYLPLESGASSVFTILVPPPDGSAFPANVVVSTNPGDTITNMAIPGFSVSTAFPTQNLTETLNVPTRPTSPRRTYRPDTTVDITIQEADGTIRSCQVKIIWAKQVSAAADLSAIGTNTTTLGQDYYLTQNISGLSSWSPIKDGSNNPFKGSLRGNSKTITVTSFAGGVSSIGLFAKTDEAWIEDLKIQHTNTYNITSYPNPTSTRIYAGLLTADANNSVFENITVSGSMTIHTALSGIAFADGGLAGYVTGASAISRSVSQVSLDIGNKDNSYAGGMVGQIDTGNTVIQDSISSGDIKVSAPGYGKVYAGGLVGAAISSGSAKIIRSAASGDISAETNVEDCIAGGLAGYFAGEIESSYARGKVKVESARNWAKVYAGGLVGYVNAKTSSTTTISNSYAQGDVTSQTTSTTGNTANVAGGIAGYVGNNNVTDRCWTSSTILVHAASSGSAIFAGGLIGQNNGTIQYSAALNAGITVSSTGTAHRICGSSPGLTSTIVNFARTAIPGITSPSDNPLGNDGSGKTDGALSNQSTYADVYFMLAGGLGWDFSGTGPWKMYSSPLTGPSTITSYPILRWQP
ncbi:MAG: hypothetical protein LBT39_04395 [Treponema sp.]|jgi:hypothetical protein|nr:hypothetical protein [Treponema sp.]